ncbi:MAG TPA: APC family permease [Actinomycetota bacterium]
MATIAEEPAQRPSTAVRVVSTKLALGGIVGIIFFSVSGGPYGLEDTIGEAGAGMGLLLIILTPVIWSLPTALMVAEMATMMPVEGGYYYWGKTALGPFWGFNLGWWMWVTSWVDLALYPVLFVDYTSYFFPILEENELVRWLVAVTLIWLFAYVNIRGAKVVGDSSKLFFAVVITPFVLVTIIGLFKMGQNPFEPFVNEGVSLPAAFGAGLFVIMWNYMGWDGMSTVMGEVEHPARDYPKALAITLPIITLIYLVPTFVSLGVVGAVDVEWTAGAYNVVAEQVAGAWLGNLLTITAMISAIGLYSAWLLQNSRIPFALAGDGFLPKALTKLHPKYKTPTLAIVIQALICSVLALSAFGSLVAIDVTIYACALMLEFFSLIAMRIKHPDLARPFKVPGGWFGVALVTLGPLFVIVVAVYFQVLDVGMVQGIGWAAAGLATGPIVYFALLGSKRRKGVNNVVDLETGTLHNEWAETEEATS